MNPTPTIPGISNVLKTNPVPQFKNLGDFLSGLLSIVFYLAVFLAFYWLVWGAFQYISASGDKNKLQQARGRITWALVGLLITGIAFLVAQFAAQILQPRGGVPIL